VLWVKLANNYKTKATVIPLTILSYLWDMKILHIINCLEQLAPPSLQESYDNAGLITGSYDWACHGVVVCLDSTEAVIEEAIACGANLVVAHHPIIFSGLKKINGNDYVGAAIIKAIKNDIAIYAIHTNLDNVPEGVNGMMADKLGLINRNILSPKSGVLQKLQVFVPAAHEEIVKDALFQAGAGHIGNYSECSFTSAGEGSFRAGEGTDPFVGKRGERHLEQEKRIEVVFPAFIAGKVVTAMKNAHPYEEVAYDLINLANNFGGTGAGLVGDLPSAVSAGEFLKLLSVAFELKLVRHTVPPDRPITRIALCGGAGSFLISKALQAGAGAFVTADMKYHEFFDANDRMLICDIGHFESEQFTIDLLYNVLREKFPNFAVLKTKVKTNPVRYFL
jgi:dinuclear metal center YbgI/SA1388 family protein